jgi:arginase family enzyme
MQYHHGTGWLNMTFVGIPSFLRAAICTNLGALDADIAVIGVPTDEGSPFMPGSRFAPRAIREQLVRATLERSEACATVASMAW